MYYTFMQQTKNAMPQMNWWRPEGVCKVYLMISALLIFAISCQMEWMQTVMNNDSVAKDRGYYEVHQQIPFVKRQ